MNRRTIADVKELLGQVAAPLGLNTDINTPGGMALLARDSRVGGWEVRVRCADGRVREKMAGTLNELWVQLVALRDMTEAANEYRAATAPPEAATPTDGLCVLTMHITYDAERREDHERMAHLAEYIVPYEAGMQANVLDYRYYVNDLDEGDRDSLALALARRVAVANGDI